MTQAIFRSTSQALHFAYLIEAYEASVESIMAKAIRRLMMECGIWDTGEPSTVDFGGLDALEVRAQCAMIQAAVRDRLPWPEASAIQAIYGINRETGDISGDGKRVQVFSRERGDAVRSLSRWLLPYFRNFGPVAVYMLVSRVVDSRCNVTFRQMAERFGLDQSTYARSLKRVRENVLRLEHMAIARLEPAFVADGVVERP